MEQKGQPQNSTNKSSYSRAKTYNFERIGSKSSTSKKVESVESKEEISSVENDGSEEEEKEEVFLDQIDSDKHKFKLLTYLTNKDLSVMEFVFENFHEHVLDKIAFILLMIELLKNKEILKIKNQQVVDTIIKDSREVYDFIDVDKQNKISFSDFSSFYMIQETGGENLSHATLNFRPKDNPPVYSNWISKLYYLEKLNYIAMIEEEDKTIKLFNAYNLELVKEVSIPKSAVSDVVFVAKHSCLIVLACDKKIYFYSTSNNFEMKTQIETPETQIAIFYSSLTGKLYSYGISAKIFGWSLEKVLTKKNTKVNEPGKTIESVKAIEPEIQFCLQKHISCMILIDSLGLIATGSNDTNIRLFDIKDLQKEPKVLVGHQKGVKAMSYSNEYQYILSWSYDFDIRIWNAIVGQPLAKLAGHEAIILEVLIPPATDYIISCDVKGCTKIWDANTLLLIEDKHPEISNIKCVTFVPKYRRIVFGGRQLSIYEYARPLDINFTEDYAIKAVVVSLKNMEIYVATPYSISIWSLEEGVQLRSMSKIMKAEITGMILDFDERKLYVADQSGRLELFDCINGRFIKSLTPHQKEITALLYSYDERKRMILSTSWDKTLRTHLEINVLNKDDLRNGVLKNLYNAHEHEILCADLSQKSGLLATGSKEAEIKIWNFQTSQLDQELKMFTSDINCVKFLDPYPLLATSDIEGNICLWTTEPYRKPYKCLVNWRNMFNLQKFSAITAMAFDIFYDANGRTGENFLFIGDGMGYIRVFDLEDLIETADIKSMGPEFKQKRKAFTKIEDVDFKARVSGKDKLKFINHAAEKLNLEGKKINVKQILQWKAHQDIVNQITILNIAQPQVLMTISNDKMVKFWNSKGENISNLYQGRTFNNSWNIKIREDYIDNSSQDFVRQFNLDLKSKYQQQIIQIQNLITKYVESYEYEERGKIESEDIFRNFSDLENSVAKILSENKAYPKKAPKKK